MKFSGSENESNENVQIVDTTTSPQTNLQGDVVLSAKELSAEYFNIAKNCENYEIRILALKQLWKITTVFKKEHIKKIMERYENDLFAEFHKWIQDENIPSEPLVGIIFATIDNMQNEELKDGVLLELTKVSELLSFISR